MEMGRWLEGTERNVAGRKTIITENFDVPRHHHPKRLHTLKTALPNTQNATLSAIISDNITEKQTANRTWVNPRSRI
jgi:hypothetical protein